jgi:endonuclease I
MIALITLTILSLSAQARTADCLNKWRDFDNKKNLKEEYSRVKNHCDLDAKMIIGKMVSKHSSISYRSAKDKMFKRLDVQDGKVYSVYSNHSERSGRVPNHRVMNAEHTWPKSKGAKKKPAVSDLHHLFPCNSQINSVRSSFPFCEVHSVIQDHGQSVLGTDKFGTTCFQPPKEHRGNVARAMFYFASRYQMRIDPKQEAWFKKWHKEDPVDSSEVERNEAISRIQRNSNPFIDQPELVDFISDF